MTTMLLAFPEFVPIQILKFEFSVLLLWKLMWDKYAFWSIKRDEEKSIFQHLNVIEFLKLLL